MEKQKASGVTWLEVAVTIIVLWLLICVCGVGCATTHGPYCSVCRQPMHEVSTETIRVPLRDTKGRFVSESRVFTRTLYACKAGHITPLCPLTLTTRAYTELPPVPRVMQAVILP